METDPEHAAEAFNPSRAFTLLEAVVALAVLGVVLTGMLTVLAQHAAVDRRIDAHTGALLALEAHHEALRSGWNPDLDESLWQNDKVRVKLDPLQVPATASKFSIWAETEPLLPAGLYRLRLDVRYALGPQTFTQTLETRFWRR